MSLTVDAVPACSKEYTQSKRGNFREFIRIVVTILPRLPWVNLLMLAVSDVVNLGKNSERDRSSDFGSELFPAMEEYVSLTNTVMVLNACLFTIV